MEFLILIAGLAGLWLGTELTLGGATSIARRLGLSEFIVGVAILSVGSDLPELAIAVDASIKSLIDGDASDIIVGSAIGSTLGQFGLVMGVAGLVAYLTLPKYTVYRHGAVLLGSIVILALAAADGTVSRVEGAGLLVVYFIYFVVLWTDVGKNDAEHEGPKKSLPHALFLLAIGFAIVIGSAELTVSSAIAVAGTLNIDESVVAILLIGVGTSLPELSISLGAVLKGKTKMSVGNLIGSNVFDTLVPIGAAAAITPLGFERGILLTELPLLFLLSAMILVFFLRRRGIQKIEAFAILGLYGGYVFYKIAASV